MKSRENYYLVMYDITDERILQKTAKLLQQHGYERINYSVWLGWDGPNENKPLFKILREMLRDPKAANSKLFILPITKTVLAKIRNVNGRKPTDLDYWIGNLEILFF